MVGNGRSDHVHRLCLHKGREERKKEGQSNCLQSCASCAQAAAVLPLGCCWDSALKRCAQAGGRAGGLGWHMRRPAPPRPCACRPAPMVATVLLHCRTGSRTIELNQQASSHASHSFTATQPCQRCTHQAMLARPHHRICHQRLHRYGALCASCSSHVHGPPRQQPRLLPAVLGPAAAAGAPGWGPAAALPRRQCAVHVATSCVGS